MIRTRTKIIAVALLLSSTCSVQAEWSWDNFFGLKEDPAPVELTSYAPPEGRHKDGKCYHSADSVKQDTGASWAKYRYTMPGHRGKKCWYPAKWDGDIAYHSKKKRKHDKEDRVPARDDSPTYASKPVKEVKEAKSVQYAPQSFYEKNEAIERSIQTQVNSKETNVSVGKLVTPKERLNHYEKGKELLKEMFGTSVNKEW